MLTNEPLIRTLMTIQTRAFPVRAASVVLAFMLALMTLLGLQLAVAPGANAHDVLVEQTPAPGETFAEAPDEIVLTFNNRPIDMGPDANQIRVTDAEGNIAIDHAVQIRDMSAVLSLDGLQDGAYHTVWQVVSSDGHSISGAFTFAVGANAEADLAALPSLEETLDQGRDDTATDTDTEETGGAEGTSLFMIIGISVVTVAAAVLAFVMMWRKSQQNR